VVTIPASQLPGAPSGRTGKRSVLEEHDGGETANANFLRELLLLICIHLGDDQTAGELDGDAIQYGR
jgi:hypothetical protein